MGMSTSISRVSQVASYIELYQNIVRLT
jgi:hypothetical protein